MKLPNWIMLSVLLFGAVGQYSINAVASETIEEAVLETAVPLESLTQETKGEIGITTSININEAQVSQLTTLPGVGIKKAEAIVKYRELNGNFSSIDELVNVNGIGPKMLAKIASYVSV